MREREIKRESEGRGREVERERERITLTQRDPASFGINDEIHEQQLAPSEDMETASVSEVLRTFSVPAG